MKWVSVAAGASASGKALAALGPLAEAALAAAAEPPPPPPPPPASPTSTVIHPMAGMEGGPTQTVISEIRAEGFFPIKTPMLPRLMGPPTWGMGGTAGVHMGHTCI